jgi:polygalacturonase
VLIILCISCNSPETDSNWAKVESILAQIKVPVFKNQVFAVTDFGAVGDFETDCFSAFRDAITECNKSGGGRVLVPPGIYKINGPVHLKSNVNLHIAKGARLEFSTNPEDYLPLVLHRWEGTDLYNYSPFIYAYQATNIALTGEGEIDGNAQNSFATWKKKQKKDQLLLRQMGNDSVPVYKRIFGPGHYLRPSMISFYGCTHVFVEGVSIYDAPFWVIHPVYCNNVIVRKLTVDSWNPNNDGVDPDGSVNVLIEDCVFNCGDDAVAIKSGRDQDGWRIGQPSENVIIRNCQMNSKANGLCIGSDMSGGVRNIYMENCQIGEAKSTIYFKSNLDRGGIIENVFVRNIKVDKASTAAIRFESNYKGHRGNNYPPIFKNFYIEDVTCQRADHYGLYAVGVKDVPISNVSLKNIFIHSAEIPFFVQYISDFKLVNVSVNDILITDLPSFQEEIKSDKKLTF